MPDEAPQQDGRGILPRDVMPPQLDIKELYVLRHLAVCDTYGWKLAGESRGLVSAAMVGNLLARLKKRNLIKKGRLQAGERGAARRLYTITKFGRRVLGAHEAMIAHWNTSA